MVTIRFLAMSHICEEASSVGKYRLQKGLTNADLLIFCAGGQQLAVWTETDASDIKVTRLSGRVVGEHTGWRVKKIDEAA